MVKLHSREGLGACLWSFSQRNNLGEGWERKYFLLQDRDDIQQFYFFHCPHDFIIKAVKSSQGLWIQIYCVVCNHNFKGYLILNYVIEHDRRDIAWSFLKMPCRAIDWSCPARQTKPRTSAMKIMSCLWTGLKHAIPTHIASYKNRSGIFHQKTILLSPLTCYGAPCSCTSNSYG